MPSLLFSVKVEISLVTLPDLFRYSFMGYLNKSIMGFQRGDSPFGRGYKGDSVPLIVTEETKIDLHDPKQQCRISEKSQMRHL